MMSKLVVAAVDIKMETVCCGSMIIANAASIPKCCWIQGIVAIRKLKTSKGTAVDYDVTELKESSIAVAGDICIVKVSS